GQQIAYAQDGGAGGGEHVEHLELRRIGVVAARHAQVANYELRHEGQVEADECDDRGKLGERLRIHAAGHLGPPEVDAGEECHQHAANHYEVEVRDDEVGFRQLDVHAQRAEKDACEPTDGEQPH